MQKEAKIYGCNECGIFINLLEGIDGVSQSLHEKIQQIKPNTTDAAQEKHLPVVKQENNKVDVYVGSIYHPMTEEHSISLVYLQTTMGGQYKRLLPTEEPVASFTLTKEDKPVAAYAYCNLHGLWKIDL